MAAFLGLAIKEDQALAGATAETVVQLVAAANHRVKLLSWSVSFDGTEPGNEPVTVKLERQTDAGTSSALTPVKVDDSLAETLLTTARKDCTAEPTSGDELEVMHVHPQAGFVKQYRVGEEIIIGGGDRVGLVCTAPDAVNASVVMKFEE